MLVVPVVVIVHCAMISSNLAFEVAPAAVAKIRYCQSSCLSLRKIVSPLISSFCWATFASYLQSPATVVGSQIAAAGVVILGGAVYLFSFPRHNLQTERTSAGVVIVQLYLRKQRVVSAGHSCGFGGAKIFCYC